MPEQDLITRLRQFTRVGKERLEREKQRKLDLQRENQEKWQREQEKLAKRTITQIPGKAKEAALSGDTSVTAMGLNYNQHLVSLDPSPVYKPNEDRERARFKGAALTVYDWCKEQGLRPSYLFINGGEMGPNKYLLEIHWAEEEQK